MGFSHKIVNNQQLKEKQQRKRENSPNEAFMRIGELGWRKWRKLSFRKAETEWWERGAENAERMVKWRCHYGFSRQIFEYLTTNLDFCSTAASGFITQRIFCFTGLLPLTFTLDSVSLGYPNSLFYDFFIFYFWVLGEQTSLFYYL